MDTHQKHYCFICNQEFDFSPYQTRLEPDNVISFGYGSKFDSQYLFPLTSWLSKKIKAWSISNLPNRKIPICDNCIERCSSLGHASVREKPMHVYSISNSLKYEFRDSESFNLCFSFEDILNDYEEIVENLFENTFEIDVQHIDKEYIRFRVNQKDYTLEQGKYLVIRIQGETKSIEIIDESKFKQRFYKG